MSTMTTEQRDELRAALRRIDAAQDPLIEARRKACEPFDSRIEALEAEKEALLDKHETDIYGRCENCLETIFNGDLGHTCNDGELVFCVVCAPTWRDLLAQCEEQDADAWEEPDGREKALALCRARVAEGKGDEKHVWEL